MSKSRNQSSIPAFLQKTYDILENPQLSEIVGWNEDGTGFVVKNVLAFQDQVLPMYFKHKNFASFVRQMNMYGFHKSKSDQKENEFIHPHFKKDQRNLLKKIKRKSGEQNDESFALVELKPHRTCTQQDRQISDLVSKQQELERVCKILIEQNNKILQYNSSLRQQLMQEKMKEKKKNQKIMDYLTYQQRNCLEDDPLIKNQQAQIFDLLSDYEEPQIQKKMKIKEDDSDSTIGKLEILDSQPLMLTNQEHQIDELVLPIIPDQQFDELDF